MPVLPPDIGVSTIAWDEWRLADALDRAGLYARLIEIYSDGLHSLVSEVNRAAALAKDRRYTVHGPYDGVNVGSLRERERRSAVDVHRRHLEAAAEVGAVRYVVHPDFAPRPYRGGADRRPHLRNRRSDQDPCSWGRDERVAAALARSFEELEEMQRETGVRVVVENMPAPGHSHLHSRHDLGRAGGEAAGVSDRPLDLGGLGFVLDAGHASVCGTLEGFLKDPPRNLAHVHLHDNRGPDKAGDPHLSLGQGVVDVAAVLRVARCGRHGDPGDAGGGPAAGVHRLPADERARVMRCRGGPGPSRGRSTAAVAPRRAGLQVPVWTSTCPLSMAAVSRA